MFLSKTGSFDEIALYQANGNCVHDVTSAQKLVILPIKALMGSAKKGNRNTESLKRKPELLVFLFKYGGHR